MFQTTLAPVARLFPHRPHRLVSRLCLTLAVFALAWSAEAQTVRHVDESALGANNGTSWADAYTDLQDALAAVTVTHCD